MTISYVGAGVFGSGTTTTVSAYPAGAAGDVILALTGNKPFDSTPTTTAGYTQLTTIATGTTAVSDGGGSTRATAFSRDVTTTAAGSDTFDVVAGNPGMSQGVRFAKTLATWDVSALSLVDTDATATAVSATGTATSGQITSGDWIVVSAIINDNTPNHTTQTVTVAGCTVGTVTWLTKSAATAGFDGGQYVGYASITAGSSTGTVTYAGTSSVSGGSATAVSVVRLREVAGATPTRFRTIGKRR